jgi:hypothetical protein
LIEPEYGLEDSRKQVLGGVLTIVAVVSLFAAGIAAYGMSRVYSKPQWGFRLHIPEDWEMGWEQEAPELWLSVLFFKNYTDKEFGGAIKVIAVEAPENIEFENFVSETKKWYTENFENMEISVTTVADHSRLVSGVAGWEWIVNLSFENTLYFEKMRLIMLFNGGRSYLLKYQAYLVDLDSHTLNSIPDYLALDTDFDDLVESFQLT